MPRPTFCLSTPPDFCDYPHCPCATAEVLRQGSQTGRFTFARTDDEDRDYAFVDSRRDYEWYE